MGDRNFAGVALIALLVASGVTRAETPASAFADTPADDHWEMVQLRPILIAHAARAALAEEPDSPRTLRLLVEARRYDEGLAVFRRIVKSHPESVEAGLKALKASWFESFDKTDRQWAALRDLFSEIEGHLGDWPPNLVPGVARALVIPAHRAGAHLGDSARALFQRLVATQPNTDVGQLAEVDLVPLEVGGEAARVIAYEEISRRHPGSAAAAYALYRMAEAIGNVSAQQKPVERFQRIVSIVTDLRSGRYPPCEWVSSALDLVWRFIPGGVATVDVERMLTAYEGFVLALDAAEPMPRMGLAELVNKMDELYRTSARYSPTNSGDRLTRAPQSLSGRFLRSLLELRREKAARRSTARAEAALESLAKGPPSPYARKALATLAAYHFAAKDYRGAVPLFRRFLHAYPDSDWAWLASLRLADSLYLVGDRAEAAVAYREAARSHAATPPARILGLLFAARIDDQDDRVEPATIEYQAALGAWHDDFGDSFQHLVSNGHEDEYFVRGAVAERLAMILAMADKPCGLELVRGRQDIDCRRYEDAVARFASLPPRCITAELVHLQRRARLEAAVDLGAYERPEAAKRRALGGLATLSKSGSDFVACVADIASASIRFSLRDDDAPTLMIAGLDRCVARADKQSEFDIDLTQIRDLIVQMPERPNRSRIGWWHDDFQYVIAPTSIRVSVGTSPRTRARVRASVAGEKRVLFLGDDEQVLLGLVHERLARPASLKRTMAPPWDREPWTEAEIFWAKFLPSGKPWWSTPVLGTVRFTDAERHHARVDVGLGDRGAEVELRKVSGRWSVIDARDTWIQ